MIKNLLNKIDLQKDGSELDTLLEKRVKDDLIEQFDGLVSEDLYKELIIFNIETRVDSISISDKIFIKAIKKSNLYIPPSKSLFCSIKLIVTPKLRQKYFTAITHLVKEII